jgi:cytochrome c biogenesis protein ResB
MSKYFAGMIVSQILERERHMAQSEYFIPFGEYVREDGEKVKVKMIGETEKAYKVRVSVVGTRSRVDIFPPKSQSRLTEDGIIVKGWLFVKSAEYANAALLLGDLLKEVVE